MSEDGHELPAGIKRGARVTDSSVCHGWLSLRKTFVSQRSL